MFERLFQVGHDRLMFVSFAIQACKSPTKQSESFSVKKTRGERQQLSKNVLLAFAMNFTKNETSDDHDARQSENARFTTINSTQSNISSIRWWVLLEYFGSSCAERRFIANVSRSVLFKVNIKQMRRRESSLTNVILGIEELSGCDINHRIEQELFHRSFAAGARSILVTDN